MMEHWAVGLMVTGPVMVPSFFTFTFWMQLTMSRFWHWWLTLGL